MNSIELNTINDQVPYSPGALTTALSNSLSSPLFNIPIRVKGTYQQGKGTNYSGVYYDILKDEFSSAAITLVVPDRLRLPISDGQVIDVHALLSRRITPATGRIDLLLNVTEILSRKEKAINEEEVKTLALIQQKANRGFKDVDHIIRSKVYQQIQVKVLMIIGTTAIVDHDIMHQMKDAFSAYTFYYKRVNLTRAGDVALALEDHGDVDFVVVSRGGGENMNVFDSLELAERAINIKPALITAIGHAADEPLLQKVADKHFITPTALGQYFYEIYCRTLDELSNSKTKLIGDLTKQIELNFQNRLRDLSTRLEASTRESEQMRKDYNRVVKETAERLAKAKTMTNITITLLIAAGLAIALYLLLSKGH